MTDLKFVQPLATKPNQGEKYWFFSTAICKPDWFIWDDDAQDNNIFDAGLTYTNPEDCMRRHQYDLQESKKLTIPEWYHLKFGNNAVEFLFTIDGWRPRDISSIDDWRTVDETMFRLADPQLRIEARAIQLGWDKVLTDPAFAEYVQIKANRISRGRHVDFISLVEAMRIA